MARHTTYSGAQSVPISGVVWTSSRALKWKAYLVTMIVLTVTAVLFTKLTTEAVRIANSHPRTMASRASVEDATQGTIIRTETLSAGLQERVSIYPPRYIITKLVNFLRYMIPLYRRRYSIVCDVSAENAVPFMIPRG